MGSACSKSECIWLPGQSGKTRTIQEKIRKYRALSVAEGSADFLHIVICSNNRALVKQTGARMESDLYTSDSDEETTEADSKIDGSVFNWFSGLQNQNIGYEALGFRILKGDINMVVVCAHKKRLGYLYQLLKELDGMAAFHKRINIWIDEADDSLSLWSKPEFDVTGFAKIHRIVLVSATFDSIRKKYDRIRVIGKEEPHPATYHRIRDCCIVEENTATGKGFTAVDYLQAVYARYRSVLRVPGMRLFAPGDIAKKTHDGIEEFLLSEGFAVAVLNGDRKEIRVPGISGPIPLDLFVDGADGVPEEVGKKIAKLYGEHGLARFPFAITGHLCIGRGLTFQNDKFLFDWGIVPAIADAAAAYQCACRLVGNIRAYPGYKQPMLVCPSKTLGSILLEESLALKVARMVYELNLADVGDEEISSILDEDFSKKEIPVVLRTELPLLEHIHGLDSAEKQRILLLLLKRDHPELAKRIRTYKCRKISCPTERNETYRVNVERPIEKAERKQKYIGGLNEDEKTQNTWIAFLDKFEGRIIIMVYHGAASA